MTIFLKAADQIGEDVSPHKEIGHSFASDHRGELRLHGDARPHRTFWNLADLARCARVVTFRLLDAASALHPRARVRRLAPRRRRLDGQAVALFRRDAVPPVDMAVSRRDGTSVFVVAEGAALSGLEGLVAGRRVVGRVGLTPSVRPVNGDERSC